MVIAILFALLAWYSAMHSLQSNPCFNCLEACEFTVCGFVRAPAHSTVESRGRALPPSSTRFWSALARPAVCAGCKRGVGHWTVGVKPPCIWAAMEVGNGHAAAVLVEVGQCRALFSNQLSTSRPS